MSQRIAILGGVRTPFCRAGGVLARTPADDLGAHAVRELLVRAGVDPTDVGEVIIGNVGQPAHAANIARVIALKAAIPRDVVAHTVHHNCASGMRSITTAALAIQAGRTDLVVAGGTESMSLIPLLFNTRMTQLFVRLMKARTVRQRVSAIASFRPAHLRPVIALQLGLKDPVCELNMGQTAEVLAREFGVTRDDQDRFALESHRKATSAQVEGYLTAEIAPIVVGPDYRVVQTQDDSPRAEQTLEALTRLKPYFDRQAGTVTVGNACPITDGAAAVLLATEKRTRQLGVEPIGYLDAWAYAALDGSRMGLGPAYAAAKLLEETKGAVEDFDLVELNEAFAAQAVANERAFASAPFAREHLDRSQALGAIDPDRLNVNGGAIAIGHTIGATGTRLVVTLLHELRRRQMKRGLATLCVGGGQGAALALEAA